MELHKGGHRNEANGCCCPICGNTCGWHQEYDKTRIEGYDTIAEYIHEKEEQAAEEEKE